MKTVPILFTFDENLVTAAAVCICSLLQNASTETFYDIIIIHGDNNVSDSIVARIPDKYKNCRISFRRVTDEFVGAYQIRGITETAYYRLLAPEIIPEYDKILYSDVDVIFRDDLTRYYEIDLGDHYFAGVDNGSDYREDVKRYLTDVLEIRSDRGYFYSGNLVINLRQLREDNMCDVFRQMGTKSYQQQDMDIMNIACNGRILPLSPSFCLTVQLYDRIVHDRALMLKYFSEAELDYALSKGIIHYNGAKPWKTWCHHFDFWWQYYRDSIIYDEGYYAGFYEQRGCDMDNMPLWRRLKLVVRYFMR